MFYPIKKNYEFLNVYHNGKSCANKYLVMYILENGRSYSRFGITVTKKNGNSVVRHRITRLIRESIRLNSDRIESGYDIVVIARVSAKNVGFRPIESALLHLCRLHRILNE